MNLIKWDRPDPLEGLSHIQREMGDLLDLLGSSPQMEGYASADFPPIIISMSGDDVIVRAELPGIKVNDLDLQVVNDVLTIKGERKAGTESTRATYLRRERNYGTFARSLVLPEKVDVDNVTASYKQGVLTVKLPKSPETKPKQVVIK